MIITRTPFRISFFGGGTDHPAWYKEHGGEVLSTSLDKYCYVSCKVLPPFFHYKHRVAYSQIECVNHIDEIQHPVVRECLRYSNFSPGVDIYYHADLPARSGMGTSSSFTVGLLHALYGLQGKLVSKKQLALHAIEVEQERIKDIVGSQDQVAASFGGFNKIEFHHDGEIVVSPLLLSAALVEKLDSQLLLFFTGFSRLASEIEKQKLNNFNDRNKELIGLRRLVTQAIAALQQGQLDDFGELLNEAWRLKRNLSAMVSNEQIDALYTRALKAGAKGGKILGAGGGGFLLLYVPPGNQDQVRSELHEFLEIPFRFEYTGSQVIFYKPD